MKRQDQRRKEEQVEATADQPAQITEDEARKHRMPSVAETMEQRLLAISHVKVLIVEGYHHVHIDAPESIFQQVLKFVVKPRPKL